MAFGIILFIFFGFATGDVFSKKPQFTLVHYLYLVIGLPFGMAMIINGFNSHNINLAINYDLTTVMVCISVFIVGFILGYVLGNARAKEDKNNTHQQR